MRVCKKCFAACSRMRPGGKHSIPRADKSNMRSVTLEDAMDPSWKGTVALFMGPPRSSTKALISAPPIVTDLQESLLASLLG